MTKEEIIKELNVCDFKDQSVLAALDTMAQGALWMQERMINKACETYCKVCFNKTTDCKEFCNDVNIFRLAMEQ